MPKTKKSWTKKHSSYKKSTNWLTKYKPRALVMYRPDVGLGRSVATRLKTVAYIKVVPAAGGVVYQLLPGSAFNPLGDLAAIQPASFDQWKALFGRYLVTGARVEIETALDAQADGACQYAAYPSTVVGPAIATATFQGYASQPYAQSGLVTFGAPARKMIFNLSAQQIIGRRTPVNAEDNGALVSASPTTGENMVLPMFGSIGGVGSSAIIFRISIIQDVVFDQRIQVVDA